MTKREQITLFIKDYISKQPQAEVTLTALQIRKWPAVDAICVNIAIPNICHAMKAAGGEYVGGVENSTTYTMRYKK